MQKETIKTIAIIILVLICVGVVVFLLYQTIQEEEYTKGFEAGSFYVVNYQTLNSKIFLFNQTGSPLELNYQQLCNLVGGANGK